MPFVIDLGAGNTGTGRLVGKLDVDVARGWKEEYAYFRMSGSIEAAEAVGEGSAKIGKVSIGDVHRVKGLPAIEVCGEVQQGAVAERAGFTLYRIIVGLACDKQEACHYQSDDVFTSFQCIVLISLLHDIQVADALIVDDPPNGFCKHIGYGELLYFGTALGVGDRVREDNLLKG